MMNLLYKAKAAAQGETRTWADGKTRKKVGKKWIIVEGGSKTPARQLSDAWRRGQEYFDYSMTTNLGELVEDVLQDRGIEGYKGLVEEIKEGPPNTAHVLYKELVDKVRSALAPTGDKKAVVDLFGKTLIQLRNQYSTKPKTRLTITRTSKKGKVYRTYEEGKHSSELPAIQPSKIQEDTKKMGGWSITGSLTTTNIKRMIKEKSAKLISGTVDPKKEWILPKKAEDMGITYRGDSLMIRVKQVDQKAQRTRATAKVEIDIPYTFAKSFLLNQIASKRTRNNFIFRMEHSAGYREYMERYGT